MNAQEFIIWLKGFFEAADKDSLSISQVNKIRQALDNIEESVEDTKGVVQPNPNYPGMPITPDNKDMVPYGTICSCNPTNGGSGICGCTIANKLVPRNSKSNIYTTTTDNIPFNWQYKEPTKQILHD